MILQVTPTSFPTNTPGIPATNDLSVQDLIRRANAQFKKSQQILNNNPSLIARIQNLQTAITYQFPRPSPAPIRPISPLTDVEQRS